MAKRYIKEIRIKVTDPELFEKWLRLSAKLKARFMARNNEDVLRWLIDHAVEPRFL